MLNKTIKNLQYYKFSAYGFLKNLRFFDAFFILFLIDQGLSYTQIGVLYAVREIAINLLEIPSGMMADAFGRRKALIISFLSYIASFLIFYFSNNFFLFLLAFILFGAGDAFRSGTHKGLIMDYLKQQGWSEQKIAYYGHTRSWSQRGSALSSIIAGLIIFTGGKDDHQSIEGILFLMEHRALNSSGKTSLKELSFLLSLSDLMITTDSGPMHIASAMGTPTVALFGPTAPWRTGPYSNNAIVLRNSISCSPCFKRKCNSKSCMDRISVEEVLDAVDKQLGHGDAKN